MSDTHLGFSAYHRLDQAEGINQREMDFYDAFRQAVDKAIELKPDIVVHAGDMFDSVRPQNRAIDFALKQIIRLSEAGIDTVLISGNHSTPRIRETGNILGIFEHLPHIHSFREAGIGSFVKDDLTVTAIPHSNTPPLHEVVRRAKPSGGTRYNVLVLHAGIQDSKLYKMDEFNEQNVPSSAIDAGFDYVALGHYHEFAEVRPGMYYSGSTERLGFGEAGQVKGVVEVDLSSGRAVLHPLKSRGMLELEPVDASELTSSEILREVKDRLSSAQVDDLIVKMVVHGVRSDAYRSIEIPAMKRLGSSALHFELKIEREEEGAAVAATDTHIGSLAHEYQLYVSALDMPEGKKKNLLEAGLPYFAEDEG